MSKDLTFDTGDGKHTHSIDLDKYKRKPKFGTSDLKDGCFLNDVDMLPLLIPDEDKDENLFDIVQRFSDAGYACDQLGTSSTSTIYLSDFANDIIADIAMKKKLVVTRNICILSGASKILNGYHVNGRTIGAILDSLYSERVNIKGWIHFGGVAAYDYVSTIRRPADMVLYGLDHYNLTDSMRNRAIFSSEVIGIVTNRFRDAFGSDTINNSQLFHLFVLSAYTMHTGVSESVKTMAEEIISHFLWNVEQMDTYLRILREKGEIPKND